MNKRVMNTQKVERSILHYTNKERRKRKLQPVVGRRALIRAARAHSRWMSRRGRKVNHIGKGYSTPSERAQKEGYPSSYVGENLWQTSGRSGLAWKSKFFWDSDWKLGKAAVITWMNSPGHRANLLRPDWRHLGVGVSRNRDGKIYLTQKFGSTPRHQSQSGELARTVAGLLLLIALSAALSLVCN